MKKKLGACVIPFKCYAKNSFLEVHAWLHYMRKPLSSLDVLSVLKLLWLRRLLRVDALN